MAQHPETPAAAKHPGGRPQRLNPDVQAEIVEVLRAAGTIEDACAKVGIHSGTYFSWRRRGLAQRRGKFRQFLNATSEAIRLRRLGCEAQIRAAGKDDWRALAWILERTEPTLFAPRVRVHIEEELRGAIDRLKADLAGEPELLERALSALVGDARGEGAGEPAHEEATGDARADAPGGEAVLTAPAEPDPGGVPPA